MRPLFVGCRGVLNSRYHCIDDETVKYYSLDRILHEKVTDPETWPSDLVCYMTHFQTPQSSMKQKYHTEKTNNENYGSIAGQEVISFITLTAKHSL